MSKAGAEKTEHGGHPPKPEGWFERELAALNADLARLETSLGPRSTPPEQEEKREHPPKRRAPRRRLTPAPDMAVAIEPPSPAAGRPASAPPPEASPTPVPQVEPKAPPAAPPPPPPIPTGTDLADPKNFGLMPPTAELERGKASADEYRLRLGRHIAVATKVLHTSGVPAAVWREWRAFEKTAQARLREIADQSTPPFES